jgi:hypothetical protein
MESHQKSIWNKIVKLRCKHVIDKLSQVLSWLDKFCDLAYELLWSIMVPLI